MRLDPNLPLLREWTEVLTQVDAPLRAAGLVGREPPPRFAEVAALLTPPQQVLWLTDDFEEATTQQGPLSSWRGVFSPGDGLARERLDALLALGEAFAPEVVALARWTLRVSPESPLARVVPALWLTRAEALRGLLETLVRRWPEKLALEGLPLAPEPRREVRAAAEVGVLFPLARWAPDDGPEPFSRGEVLSQALLALWRVGAEDAALVRFHEDFLRAWGQELDTLSRWMPLEDPGDARFDPLRTRVNAPRPFRLEPRPVRSYESVRERIDARLGEGHCGVDEAARRLAPVERVTWALDELYAAMCQHTFHLWDQNWVERDFEGPGFVSRIAWAAREVEPLASDLFRWTARWASERGIPLVSLVPEVWPDGLDAGETFIRAIAERWPEDLEPHLLPDAPRWDPPPRVPAPGPVLHPDIAIGFTSRGEACAVRVPEKCTSPRLASRVLFALWRAGVGDDELAAFAREYHEAPRREPEVLSRWVLFDGDGGDAERREALRERLHPQDPIARWMGVPTFEAPLFLLVDEPDLDELQPHLTRPELERLVASPEYGLTPRMRAVLRQDPDWLMVAARELDADGARLLLEASFTGHGVIVGGSDEELAPLRDAFTEYSVPWERILDYRRGRGRRPPSA
ncbi:hypothetical protein [Archangium primigenium]|uniref:hypothetical protein n=1 Tax=[Archangium] primigenium TaxID=2792470 RepID=UPI00195B79D9|nr:hypothetical protein [Archangium primigenium]MBM7118955.1 hypothetical protein [Archangium primigenium]